MKGNETNNKASGHISANKKVEPTVSDKRAIANASLPAMKEALKKYRKQPVQ